MISKLIHQIWFQDNKDIYFFSDNLDNNINRVFSSMIPFQYKLNLIKLLSQNKDYSYCLWNQTKIYNLIKLFYPNLLQLYQKLEYRIQKIDFAKYIILYHYGGIYIDIDVESKNSLDHFFKIYPMTNLYFSKVSYINDLEDKILKKFYNYKSNNYFVNNGIIIAKRKHPFFKDLLNDLKFNILNNNDYFYNSKIFNTTGPSLLTNSILKHLYKYQDIVILDSIYFEPCYGKDPSCKLKNDTILKHLHKSIWLENIESDNLIINFIFNSLFSITGDSIFIIYFYFIRGYKILYLTILIIIYLYNKN